MAVMVDVEELKAGFYNAVLVDGEPDRVYNADEVNDFLEGLISNNGVFANVSTACQVLSGSGLNVVVKAGKGMVDNHWFRIESDVTLDLEAADVILNRIDSVVVKNSNTDRKITLQIKKGTLATNPTPPTLTRTEDEYEICLANILVNKNVTVISQSMITDTRPNNNVCGWITGLINQMDTTTLFNQYEEAQNNFINEKTTEYNEWETNQQTNFDNWFNGIQDEVKSTTLYREYQAVYKTVSSREQVITIPSSINYIHNGLDVLNVFINGRRLIKDVEYSMSSDGASINLTTALDVVGTDVEFVNKKSIDGTIAENVVVQVEDLQNDVNNLSTNIYLATGENDNIKLSDIVKNFLNGTGEYSSAADNASMKINVSGVLTIDTLIEDQMVFDFHSSIASNRRITIDFGNATIPVLPRLSEAKSTFAVIGCEDNVTVENANIKIEDYNASTIYCFHGGIAKNCKIIIDNQTATSVYATWRTYETSNCEININTNGTTVYGTFATSKTLFNKIIMNTGISIRAGDISIGNLINQPTSPFNATIELANVTVS